MATNVILYPNENMVHLMACLAYPLTLWEKEEDTFCVKCVYVGDGGGGDPIIDLLVALNQPCGFDE